MAWRLSSGRRCFWSRIGISTRPRGRRPFGTTFGATKRSASRQLTLTTPADSASRSPTWSSPELTGYEFQKGGKLCGTRELPIRIEGQLYRIRPHDDDFEAYSAALKELKQHSGVGVLADIVVDISDESCISDAKARADELCLLLSLASGTWVTWVYYDCLSDDGAATASVCRDSITKGFGPLFAIDPRSPDGRHTREFVESAYPKLVAANHDWLIRHVIQAYIDSKSSGDFLESRALKACCCLDVQCQDVVLGES